MKIIEAMKRVKANKEKIADLQARIASSSANLSHETPLYGPDTAKKINEWIQSCEDTTQENIRLLCAIQRTNMATAVSIELGDKTVTKTIAEWVWRRREYAKVDLDTWSKLTDRGLREGHMNASTGVPIEVKISRHYDPTVRDLKLALYKLEPFRIDGALEVINATTDLME